MQHSNHFTKGWHLCKRLSCVTLLSLMLGIAFQSPLVQAQDNGGQTFAAYELVVVSPAQDRFCIGQNTPVVVKVQAHPLVIGGPGAGRVTVRNVAINATTQDSSIATAEVVTGSAGNAPDVPFESYLRVTGVGIGNTAVVVDITGGNTNRFGVASGFQLRKNIPVRVVPCEYKVTLSSFWATTMYSANVAIGARLTNAPLTSTGGITFSDTSDQLDGRTNVAWSFMTNRLRGCEIGNDKFNEQGTVMAGAIVDNELTVTITIHNLPTSTNLYINCHRNLPSDRRIQSCEEYRDATCHPANEGGQDWFIPAAIEVKVPVRGGTVNVPHSMTHSQGTANGFSTVTITPVTP